MVSSAYENELEFYGTVFRVEKIYKLFMEKNFLFQLYYVECMLFNLTYCHCHYIRV